jgi:hypothetical protein
MHAHSVAKTPAQLLLSLTGHAVWLVRLPKPVVNNGTENPGPMHTCRQVSKTSKHQNIKTSNIKTTILFPTTPEELTASGKVLTTTASQLSICTHHGSTKSLRHS